MAIKQKITPFLWFDDNAEAAINLYLSIFANSRLLTASRYGDNGPGPKGTIMTAKFELEGQLFVALNGGPHFKFSEAISLVVECESQDEVDNYWEKLSAGGQKSQCGWLKDKFGLSWQIVPTALMEMMQDPDAARRGRVMQAMMQMHKLEIAPLERAFAGG